jgi:hypothetical protein
MKKILFLGFVLTLHITAVAQTVSILTSGSGNTKQEAETAALRSAIEQTFGVYLSSNTEVLDDELIKDEILTISSGNIHSYKILDETRFPDGTWVLNLNTLVSVEKLKSFVESKGAKVTLKGSLLAANIIQQSLDLEAEEKIIDQMLNHIKNYTPILYDFEIIAGEPQRIAGDNWVINVTVNAIANKNMGLIRDYVFNTLKQLKLSNSQIETYRKQNQGVFCFEKGPFNNICLRSNVSIAKLGAFASTLINRSTFFKIDPFPGITNSNYIHQRTWYRDNNGTGIISEIPTFSMPKDGTKVVSFTIDHKVTFQTLKKLEGYQISPGKEGYQGINPDSWLFFTFGHWQSY